MIVPLDANQMRTMFKAGRYEEIRVMTHRTLVREPRNQIAAMYAALADIARGKVKEFDQVMEFWVGNGGDESVLGERILRSLLEDRNQEALKMVADGVPRTSRLWIIAHYYGGCAALMAGNVPAAIEKFNIFRASVSNYAGKIDFRTDPGLNNVLRQGRLIANAATVERRMEALPEVPDITWLGKIESAPAILFAAGDAAYINRFAEGFVTENLSQLGAAGLHLHLIEPDQAARDRVERLIAAHPGRLAASIEAQAPIATATYFACDRFFTLSHILARYKKPVLSADIDCALAEPVEFFLAAAADNDLAAFKSSADEPASVWSAELMYWANTEAARTFLYELRKYCWVELKNPSWANWQLDQAALLCLLARENHARKFGDFTELTGKSRRECVRDLGSDKIRQELRTGLAGREPKAVQF